MGVDQGQPYALVRCQRPGDSKSFSFASGYPQMDDKTQTLSIKNLPCEVARQLSQLLDFEKIQKMTLQQSIVLDGGMRPGRQFGDGLNDQALCCLDIILRKND